MQSLNAIEIWSIFLLVFTGVSVQMGIGEYAGPTAYAGPVPGVSATSVAAGAVNTGNAGASPRSGAGASLPRAPAPNYAAPGETGAHVTAPAGARLSFARKTLTRP